MQTRNTASTAAPTARPLPPTAGADVGKSAVTALLGGAASPVLAGGAASLARMIPCVATPIAVQPASRV